MEGDFEHLAGDELAEAVDQGFAALEGDVLVDDDGEGIDGFAGDENVEFDHRGGAMAGELIVQRGVAPGGRLQTIVEIEHDFVEGEFVAQDDAFAADVFEFLLFAAFFFEESQDFADVLFARDDGGIDDGLIDDLDRGGVGPAGRVFDENDFPAAEGDFIANTGGGGDEIDIEFAFEPLLDDFQMEESEKAAAEAEAEGDGVFGFKVEGRIVETEFFEGVAEEAVLGAFAGVETGEDHGFNGFEAGQGGGGGVNRVGDRIADQGIADRFDVGVEEADFAGAEFFVRDRFGRLIAEAFDFEHLTVRPEFDFLAEFDAAIDDAHEDDNAFVGVEPRVEDQGGEGGIRVTGGRGDALNDLFEDFGDADALFGGAENGFGGIETDEGFDLFADALGVGGGEIDLIDNRDNLEVLIEGEIGIGEGLGFDSLGGIDHQEGPFAGLERAGDFVGEIDVAGGIDEIQLVDLPIFRFVEEANGMGFDRDATFAFEVHGIQDLGHHFALGEGTGMFQKAIGEGGLAVVDVGDDGEVSNV